MKISEHYLFCPVDVIRNDSLQNVDEIPKRDVKQKIIVGLLRFVFCFSCFCLSSSFLHRLQVLFNRLIVLVTSL